MSNNSNRKAIEFMVQGALPPHSTNVLWMDTSVPELPVLKIFENGSWATVHTGDSKAIELLSQTILAQQEEITELTEGLGKSLDNVTENLDTLQQTVAKEATSQKIFAAVQGIDINNLAKEATLQEVRQDASDAKVAAQALVPVAAAAEAYNTGKAELAQNITSKGVEASANETLPELAEKVAQIAQEPVTINGGELYPRNLWGESLFDLFSVAAQIRNDYAQYKGFILARYYKGYSTIDLTQFGNGISAYLTCDGDLYENAQVHTWHDDDTGKMDRWIAFLYTYDEYNFQSLTDGLCPRTIVVYGKCSGINIDYNRLDNVWVDEQYGELSSFSIGINSPQGNWAPIQCIRNYKQTSRTSTYFIKGDSNSKVQFVSFPELEILDGGNGLIDGISNSGSMPQLQGISVPKLKISHGGCVINASGNRNSPQFSALTNIAFPELEEITITAPSRPLIYGIIANLSSLSFPKLKKVKTYSGSDHVMYGVSAVDFDIHFDSLEEYTGEEAGHLNYLLYNVSHLRRLYLPNIELAQSGYGHGIINNAPSLIYMYIGYKDNDKSKAVQIYYSLSAPKCTDIELKDGFCKPLRIDTFTALTEANIYSHILQRLKQDEEGCGNGVTITLGTINLDKLTSDESVTLLQSLRSTYGYTIQ